MDPAGAIPNVFMGRAGGETSLGGGGIVNDGPAICPRETDRAVAQRPDRLPGGTVGHGEALPGTTGHGATLV
jgi:hypothetical protein